MHEKCMTVCMQYKGKKCYFLGKTIILSFHRIYYSECHPTLGQMNFPYKYHVRKR
jgi:hypothetical protein